MGETQGRSLELELGMACNGVPNIRPQLVTRLGEPRRCLELLETEGQLEQEQRCVGMGSCPDEGLAQPVVVECESGPVGSEVFLQLVDGPESQRLPVREMRGVAHQLSDERP
jgi:hypothetical protein